MPLSKQAKRAANLHATLLASFHALNELSLAVDYDKQLAETYQMHASLLARLLAVLVRHPDMFNPITLEIDLAERASVAYRLTVNSTETFLENSAD